jgi:glucokinase
MKKSRKNILTFDIGGTKIASGIVEIGRSDYKIYDYQKINTPKTKKDFVQKVIELLVYYQRDSGFKRVGISIAGQIDEKNDIVKYVPNIKGWRNVDLKKIIRESIGNDVEIDNDVKCFALAENKFGKSSRYRNVVYLAIGTGIGGAIEINDKLYRGVNNTAGEFGHMVVSYNGKKCACGNKGCLEQYVSGKAIEKLYYEFYGKKKKAKDIALDSVKNSQKDKKIIKDVSLYLSAGLVNIINIINPEAIIVGGSVVKQQEILDLAAKDAMRKVLCSARKTKILRSDLDEEAFLVGAALLFQ